ncbi:HNH endonuclease [Neorhodopirellula pilleata]|uniref:HNH domain-containing protein n=1 Tax=Neorhodopirellula pilleata TaxID=2714738 RepID=A0A5C6A6Z6_9BACT|nr:HNH endonuclease [Neorhodopirellula pilleata]TWT95762.1 hypothetical protein Pla100_34040 [Neorhodopirellula pilleata]
MTSSPIIAHRLIGNRAHYPRGYEGYQRYKQWLRDEFQFTCVYCLHRETWDHAGHRSFSVEHKEPQSKNGENTHDYMNLVYACVFCNSCRQDIEIPDPESEAFSDHLTLLKTGRFQARTAKGRDLIDTLYLNESSRVRMRNMMLQVVDNWSASISGVNEGFKRFFEYPDDMPDLRGKRPPGGNAIAGSEDDCHYARRERGELAQWF